MAMTPIVLFALLCSAALSRGKLKAALQSVELSLDFTNPLPVYTVAIVNFLQVRDSFLENQTSAPSEI